MQDSSSSNEKYPDLYEASISELQNGLEKGLFDSVALVKAYLSRIDEVNLKGAALHAVIETNPGAVAQAEALDLERKTKGKRGPLHGIPLLLKDNIATLHSEGMNTTAGSHALVGSVVPRDAFTAAKLREAGAILLGKANLSEWANFRGLVPQGFSGRGGQTMCPYSPRVDPAGSSSGSGVAIAVGLAAGSLGTETRGSIVMPSGRNNIVGIKPTVGLTSRAGVIPISNHQDTVGPMCRTVTDAALLLSVIAGPDPRDEATLSQPTPIPDYMQALNRDGLRGARLGVPRRLFGDDEVVNAAFDAALPLLRELGAEIVDPADFDNTETLLTSESELVKLTGDFKDDINKYLAELVEVPTGVKTLADIIAFNKFHAELELVPPHYDDQFQLIKSENSSMDDAYFAALAEDMEMGRSKGIDATLGKFKLDALIIPMNVRRIKPSAISGYPSICVPLGFQPDDVQPVSAILGADLPLFDTAPGVPFGIAFFSTAYTEFKLISYAYAYEQATHTRLKRRAYPAAVPQTQLKDVMEERSQS